MAKNQRHYTPEFKQQIVDLYNAGATSYPQLECEYGINRSTLIQNNLHVYMVSQLCSALKFLRSTYYKALVCVPSNLQREYEAFSGKVNIEEKDHVTRWLLEGSVDGVNYMMIENKAEAGTDLSHDLVVRQEGIKARYLRLTVLEIPYRQNSCISGLRAFGIGKGKKPEAPCFKAVRTGDLDMEVRISAIGAVGYNILWGHEPDKLYHSYMVFGRSQRIGALVKGRHYYVRVDAFNENGITEGTEIVRV